jgi:CRISPR/Cas system-associated exonuclease Cas4 (RecB family)
VPEEEEDEAQVEASLDELIAKKADRPAPVDEDDDEVVLSMSRDESREPLTTRVLPVQQNEFICKSCYLVKHRSQLADQRRTLCRDCA